MNDNDTTMIQCLAQQGHSRSEIEGIIGQLDQYDKRAIRESVFDSIAEGSFKLDALITELNHDTSC